MSADRDITRVVRSWLRRDENESAHRVLHHVLGLLDDTPQRHSVLRAPTSDVGRNAKLLIATAAVLVVAVVGINLLPSTGDVGRSKVSVSPLPSATLGPSHSPVPAAVNPGTADLTNGRYSLTVEGVPFSFSVPASGWEPFGSLLVSKSTVGPQGAEAVVFWTGFPYGVNADACAYLLNPSDGISVAKLAEAVSTAHGTRLVLGPSDVTVGGRPAKHVVLNVREDVGCDPGFFYNWRSQTGGAMWQATRVGDTIRVWIVEVHGVLLFVEGETNKDASRGLEQEIQQIVDSIRFE